VSYSREHARVREAVERAQCTRASPYEVLNCVLETLERVGYAARDARVLNADARPAVNSEGARFIRVEAFRGSDPNTHIFTFALIKFGTTYKPLWLQSAVVER
jgi:hypothetical protein